MDFWTQVSQSIWLQTGLVMSLVLPITAQESWSEIRIVCQQGKNEPY